MEKKKKNAAFCAMQIMRLEFFAKRFNIAKKLLSWGLIVSDTEDGQIEITAGILIKDNHNVFIDILNDRIMPKINSCGCKCTSYIAIFNRVKGGYKFVAGDEKRFLSCEEIEKVYRSKLYSAPLND